MQTSFEELDLEEPLPMTANISHTLIRVLEEETMQHPPQTVPEAPPSHDYHQGSVLGGGTTPRRAKETVVLPRSTISYQPGTEP